MRLTQLRLFPVGDWLCPSDWTMHLFGELLMLLSVQLRKSLSICCFCVQESTRVTAEICIVINLVYLFSFMLL